MRIPNQSAALTPISVCLRRAGSKLLAASVLFSMWNLSHFEVNPQTALNVSGLRSHPIQGNRFFSLPLASYMPKQFSVSAAKISSVSVTENRHAGISSLKRYLSACKLFRLLAASNWLNQLKSCTKRIIFKKYTSIIPRGENLHSTTYAQTDRDSQFI